MSIKVANGSIVQHMGINGDRLQCRHLCQKIGLEGPFQKCSMTFQAMLQASSIYKGCKWKHSSAYGNQRQPTATQTLMPKIWSGRTFINIPCHSQQCSRPLVSIKVAKGGIVQHMGTIPARLGSVNM